MEPQLAAVSQSQLQPFGNQRPLVLCKTLHQVILIVVNVTLLRLGSFLHLVGYEERLYQLEAKWKRARVDRREAL
jgi:hypothetical protein